MQDSIVVSHLSQSTVALEDMDGAEASDALLTSNDVIVTHYLSRLSPKQFVWLVALFAAMGGLLFGYDIGVISGVLLFLRKDFHLTSAGEELLVSFVLVGGVLGVLAAGYLSDLKGRKQTIAYADVLFSVGALVMAVCPRGMTWLLIVGRFVVGLGIGLAFIPFVFVSILTCP